MSDFYPATDQLNARNDDVEDLKEKSLAEELSEQLTLADSVTSTNQTENVVLTDHNVQSESVHALSSEPIVGFPAVHYPVLPDGDTEYLESFEAGPPPAAYDEEVCEAATAPPIMFYEASAPLFEDQLTGEAVASEQLMQQEAEENYAAIQPFTESQVNYPGVTHTQTCL